jgi:starch phosphorylase
MKKGIVRFSVQLSLPEPLRPLLEIAYNLWWTWNPEAARLFERAAPELWEKTRHNPILMMGYMTLDRFRALTADTEFMKDLATIHEQFKEYMSHPTWCERVHGQELETTIAYFSTEFGLHECFPIYSGGLGVLSGDHLKSASDLGLPLVGVGLFYRHGYFSQYLSPDGWQMESYLPNDFFNMPARLVRTEQGKALLVPVPLPGREVFVQVWRVQVGRVPLYLLDADVEHNSLRDREITSYLYGGGVDTRIEQEIILGIGGIRTLDQLNIRPSVCHMNEGHSAFLALERIRQLVQSKGVPFEVAREVVTQTNVFTTHTPVPAGIDKFPEDLMRTYFGEYVKELGISIEELMRLGKENPDAPGEMVNMAVLALRLSAFANGVSELHGRVSRRMWEKLWPNLPEEEVPIRHITNGIHTQSWFSTEFAALYNKYLGCDWLENPVDQEVWKKVDEIPDAELWECRNQLRKRLVDQARRRMKEQLTRRGAHPRDISLSGEVLNPDALTIGFARRFATYKRATLLFRDLDRLKRLVGNSDRPVQFVFAGKAHPRDNQGKELIRQIVQISRTPEFRHSIVFLPNYDIELARYMLQGVDVWLNTPRRPMEASGTSGMKGPVSGVLNFSVLDGWWCEGYDGRNGWAIGAGEEYQDHEYQDMVESQALYDILEKNIIPLYYDRDEENIPRSWIAAIKQNIKTICPVFNTNRMVEEYMVQYYLPAFRQHSLLMTDDFQEARATTEWKRKIKSAWNEIGVQSVEPQLDGGMRIGDSLPVRVSLALGQLTPRDIAVEAYHGRLDEGGQVTHTQSDPLEFRHILPSGLALYEGTISCETTGQRGLMVRVIPRRDGAPHKFYLGLIKWWEG